ENTVEGIFQSTPEGRLLSVNPAFARALGYASTEEIIEKVHHVGLHYADPEVRAKFLRDLNEKGFAKDFVFRMKRLDGGILWVSSNARAVKDEDGKVLYYEGTVEDITRRKEAEEELNKLAAIVRHSGELVNLADTDGRMVFLNKAGSRILGIEPEEVEGTYIMQIVPDHLKDLMRNEVLPTLDANGSWEGELQYVNQKTGEVTDVHALIFTIDDQEGSFHKNLVNISLDITLRKQNERIIREKEELLSGITRNIPSVLFQIYAADSGEYGVSYLSDRFGELFGLRDPAETLFAAFISQVHEEDLQRFMDSLRTAVDAFAPWEFEGRFNKPSGEVMWFHSLSTPVRQEDRIVFDGIFLDITERKQAEERSRQAEEKFAKVFMTTPECIVISRLQDGRLLDVNQGFEDISGWKRNEVLGRTVGDIDIWVDPGQRDSMVDDLKAGRDILQREGQFRRKDGALRRVVFSARSINIAGEPSLILIIQDITDRIRLEEERRRLEHQLHQAQKMDAIGQLAGGVAHDFNNILMGIQGNATLLLLDHSPDDPHYERLSRIEEQVQRGANLTRQLLGFAREGKYELRSIAVNDLVRKSACLFIETRREIEVGFELQDDVCAVEADAGQMEQVLLNIYINAGHAMPNGGRLVIQTSNLALNESEARVFETSPGNYVKISITDTGIGMDADTLKRVFEPFFTTKLQEGGTGLGLASAYGIIRNHGGFINAYSVPAQGATFNIYLPATEEEVLREEPLPEKDLYPGSGGILVVDDEPAILELASEMLQILGYTVFQAESEAEAVSVYREKQAETDLVILDMILHGTSGAQVLKRLREISPGVKVILSSGYGLQGEVRKVMEMGCLGFIQKPYNFRELSDLVHQVLNPSSKAEPGGISA
ncbi:MAG: PAS domain S-box protein, partial [Desulfobacteraceae bacterium]|nr:PAS domain S-box protein [Desulfobacteraceae bacterium]